MSTLLHICCAPCLVFPALEFEREGIDFTGYFYNPNIHPYREFKKRLQALQELALQRRYKIIYDKDYGLIEFLQAVVFKESKRCRFCYRSRLEKTAQLALDNDFDSFSSTLLYSKYQNHEQIVFQAKEVESDLTIPFLYRDFRSGWQQGVDESITANLYRQSYCGCIYSEQERYDNRLKKRLKKKRISHV